jgi:hypothetical protein
MMKKILASIAMALGLAGCHHMPLDSAPVMTNSAAKDATLVAPNFQFLETPQSKSIIVGSQVYAAVNACQIIKRYRIVTNTDFTGSMNLMKYRAALMGAKWITIVAHREVDRMENSVQLNDEQIIFRDGVDIGSARYLTTLIADLYDCPCTVNSCNGR